MSLEYFLPWEHVSRLICFYCWTQLHFTTGYGTLLIHPSIHPWILIEHNHFLKLLQGRGQGPVGRSGEKQAQERGKSWNLLQDESHDPTHPQTQRSEIQMCKCVCKHTPIHSYICFQILKYFRYLRREPYEVFSIKECFAEEGSFHFVELFCFFLFVHLFVS